MLDEMTEYREMLKNLPFFWNMKTQIVSFVCFLLHATLFFLLNEFPGQCLEHFIKHKPLISEEWSHIIK